MIASAAPEVNTMLCLLCGAVIQVNPARMCGNCLNREVDITEGISKSLIVFQCKGCLRYLKPPFVTCDWESRELLALCLKKVKGLNKTKVIDAQFIYTEPHSKRIKLKITIQKEALSNIVVEGLVFVDFAVHSHHCDDCKRSFTPHKWNARVQVRQKVDHKRTLLLLEQLIQRHSAHEAVAGIEEEGNGLDFQFMEKSQAEKFAQFVQSHMPSTLHHSKKLISHDEKNAVWRNQHSIIMQLCPVCKDDLVFFGRSLSRVYGIPVGFYVATKITTIIHLVCPFTLKRHEITNDKYWKNPFPALLNRRHFVDYIVLSVTPEDDGNSAPKWQDNQSEDSPMQEKRGYRHRPYQVAYIEVARVSDFGRTDERMTVKSHLGNHVGPMQILQGYDLAHANFAGDVDTEIDRLALPSDVILVRRVFKKKSRPWVLMKLPKESGGGKVKGDEEMLDLEELKIDIEDDLELQKQVNIYKDPLDAVRVGGSSNVMTDDEDDDERPIVELTSLIEGLSLEEIPKDALV